MRRPVQAWISGSSLSETGVLIKDNKRELEDTAKVIRRIPEKRKRNINENRTCCHVCE